ncbi:MAG: UbiA-like polyprenyltransferase [Planctomycetaceae bacterium]
MIRALFRQFAETAEMIKISHSVFALPFALAAVALASRAEGVWSWTKLLWIVACAVTARTAAMAQNRLLDARLDAANPRTASRAVPAGRVSRRFVAGLVVAASALFVACAGQLNRLCLLLSPVALAWLLSYPLAKRFTALAHFWLGAALGLAPVGAWVAVRGSFLGLGAPLALGAGVALWTSGFDLIYACQDIEADRRQRLFSIPARLGAAVALRLARLLHVTSVACFGALFWAVPELRAIYAVGLAAASALLAYEHSLVKPHDLSRVNLAFFTLNGFVSLLLGAAIAVDAWV